MNLLTNFLRNKYNKPINELVSPISYRVILDTFRKEVEKLKNGFNLSDKYFISLEIKLLHKRNISVWVDLKATILQNQFGEPIGFQGILHNIQEKKQSLELFTTGTKGNMNLLLYQHCQVFGN